MPKVVVEPGRIRLLQAMSPYDGFVRDFVATLQEIKGVLISGYPAIHIGDVACRTTPWSRARALARMLRLDEVTREGYLGRL